MTNEIVTARPRLGTASPSTTKMPVPSGAPMLIMVSCHMPSERFSEPPWPRATPRDQRFHRLAPHDAAARGAAPGGGGVESRVALRRQIQH